MARVKRGAVAHYRRKKRFLTTKGAIGSSSYLFRIAQQHSIKTLRYAFRGRCERKRQYRSLWLVRLNAGVRTHGWNYNTFFYHLRQKKCSLNRKVLAQLVIYDPTAFQTLLNLYILICLLYLYLTIVERIRLCL